jgi:hypothetical protein
MAVTTLDDFFREKRSQTSSGDLDVEQRRKDWEAAIDNLYHLVVDDFLAKPILEGSVKVDYGFHELSLNFLGMYKVKTLIIYVGNERVTFWPKAQNVVGSDGRVDIQGQMGEATLILQPGSRWMLIAQRVPTVSLLPFNTASFLNVLKNVMRP